MKVLSPNATMNNICQRKPITIMPIGGLCNRLRVVDSAMALNGYCDVEVEIVWNINGEVGAGFNELFTVDKDCKPNSLKVKSVMPDCRPVKRLKEILGLDAKQEAISNIEVKNLRLNCSRETILNEIVSRRAIRTCYRFWDSVHPYEWLGPSRRIEKYLRKYSIDKDRTLGVHFRGTDRRKHYTEFIMRCVIDEAAKVLDSASVDVIYVATDEMSFIEIARKRFGSRVFCLGWDGTQRDTRKGAYGAMVDVMNLSETSSILSNTASSFSRFAAAYGNVPCRNIAEERDCERQNGELFPLM